MIETGEAGQALRTWSALIVSCSPERFFSTMPPASSRTISSIACLAALEPGGVKGVALPDLQAGVDDGGQPEVEIGALVGSQLRPDVAAGVEERVAGGAALAEDLPALGFVPDPGQRLPDPVRASALFSRLLSRAPAEGHCWRMIRSISGS